MSDCVWLLTVQLLCFRRVGAFETTSVTIAIY